MDSTTRRIADFAIQTDLDAFPAETIRECKRRIIDTFASAVVSYHEPVCRMARVIAAEYTGGPTATIWGSGKRTTLENAAFANGIMVRFMDVSDTYVGKSRGHPSDVISAIVAVGEHVGADGRALINAVTLAYDLYCSFIDAVDINTKGWDQPVYGVVACAAGAAKLLGLSHEQTGHAISLALAPNMALAQSRSGALSHWKGCAGANAARNGVFAAMLAKNGFTGPTAVFEGIGGLYEVVGPFEWKLPEPGAPRMVTRTHIKSLPLCFHGQSAVLVALDLRKEIPPGAIAEIRVDTYRTAVAMMAGDRERWAPANRETADHSLPYVLAVAWIDGRITPESFTEERLRDPAVGALMQKVTVFENPEVAKHYPEGAPARLSVKLKSGETIVREMKFPNGHASNPLSDSGLDAKFKDLWSGYGDIKQCERVLSALWAFEDIKNLRSEVFDLLTVKEKAA